ncbi:MAG: methyltransferase domain-containing protein [Bacteroidota bacterium]
MRKESPSSVERNYWTTRYHNQQTGWNIGYVSTPIKAYVDQLEDKSIKILIPGAGNAYEAEYLFQRGFEQVHVLDIAQPPLDNLLARAPNFPKAQLMQSNFFEHQGQYDLILEQTFFCSFLPTKENRTAYAKKMYELLKPNGKLIGLWFEISMRDKRPFGGTREEYLTYFEPYFQVQTFEQCYNSIEPRQGNELFGIFKKVNE